MSETPETQGNPGQNSDEPIVEYDAVLEPGQPKPRGLKRYIPVAVVFVAFTVFFVGGFQSLLSFETLSQNRSDILAWTDANQTLAVAAFIAAYVVVVGLSLPGGVWLTLAGGFVFGGNLAGTYVVVGATVGATIIFLAARYAFADLFQDRVGTNIAKMKDGFRKDAFSYLLFLRLVPVFPFWLVNLVPALLDVKLRTYVVATFFGIIPGTFVYAHVGAGLGEVFEQGGTPDMGIIFEPGVLFPILGLAALSLVPIIYNKIKGSA